MLDLAFAIFFALMVLSTGSIFLRIIGVRQISILSKAVCSFALGVVLLQGFVFLFGVLGLLQTWVFMVLLGLMSLFSIICVRDTAFLLKHSAECFFGLFRERASLFYAVIGTLFAFLITASALAPVTAIDALVSHYALPKLYLEAGRIFDISGYIHAHQPQGMEMMNLLIMALRSVESAAVFNSFFSIFLALAVYDFARDLDGKMTGLIAASLIYASYLFWWLSTGSFAEPCFGFLAFMALSSMSRWFKGGSSGFLILSGLFVGSCASVKYLGLAFMASLGIYYLLECICRKKDAADSLRFLLIWGCAAFVTGSHWYIYNFITTGNPVFPILFDTLGGKGWNPSANADLIKFHDVYGYGRGVLDLVKVPFDLTFRGKEFDQGQFVGFAYILAVPFAFMKRGRARDMVLLFALFVTYGLLWFNSSQQARYLLPVLAVLSILAACGICDLFSRSGRTVRWTLSATIAGFFVFHLAVTARISSKFMRPLFGQESREQFLKANVWGYPCIKWMNENLSGTDRVFFYGFGAYYLDIPYILRGYDAEAQGLIDYARLKNEDDLYRELKSLGVTHVYTWGRYLPDTGFNLWSDLRKRYLEEVWAANEETPSGRSNPLIESMLDCRVFKLK